jgi:hypothetical protein
MFAEQIGWMRPYLHCSATSSRRCRSRRCPCRTVRVPISRPSSGCATPTTTGRRRACPFPTAPDPFTCNRHAIADFAAAAQELGVRYFGLCCGAAKHHVRAMAEALGRTPPAAGSRPTCPSTPSWATTAPSRRKRPTSARSSERAATQGSAHRRPPVRSSRPGGDVVRVAPGTRSPCRATWLARTLRVRRASRRSTRQRAWKPPGPHGAR